MQSLATQGPLKDDLVTELSGVTYHHYKPNTGSR
jgi:hypothetical protein